MKQIISALLAMALLCSLLSGCGAAGTKASQADTSTLQKAEPAKQDTSTDSTEGTDFYNISRGDSDGESGTAEIFQEPEEETQSSGGYISGDWGEKFVRSNGYTYPYVFDEPLLSCRGFTLDFIIVEVIEGNLDGNFRWEIYIQTTDGTWKSAELFQMEGDEISVDVRFDSPVNIAAVAVVCQKKTNASFRSGFGVRDPI